MKTSYKQILVVIAPVLVYIFLPYIRNWLESSTVNGGCLRDSKTGTFETTVPGDCFFSDSYEDAREKFISLARAAGAELYEYPICIRRNEALTTNVAIIRGASSGRVIIHLSGVHGQEGYAGSAVQAAALNYFARQSDSSGNKFVPNMTIVFIHAVNPFGFKYDRRTNEDNIDLNRNFLTEEEFKRAVAREPNFAGYVDVDHILNPTDPLSDNVWINDIQTIATLVKGAANHGILKVKKAMVSGNYQKPSGLSYGGSQLSKSARTVIDIVNSDKLSIFGDTDDSVRSMIVIDVHTGLGPQGIDTLMIGHQSNASKVESIFPTEYLNENTKNIMQSRKGHITGGVKEVLGSGSVGSPSSGYEETIGTTDSLCTTWRHPMLSPDKSVCVTQEFGTVNSIFVGNALIKENQAFFGTNDALKQFYAKRMRDVFFVNKTSWKKNIVRRGVAVIIQAMRP